LIFLCYRYDAGVGIRFAALSVTIFMCSTSPSMD